MSKKNCYFKCKYEGSLYNFPPLSYKSYDKYCKWKTILRKEDREKSEHYISHNIKVCNRHFEKFYFTANNRLMKHAVPSLKLGITLQQEELLCSFIEKNSELVMDSNLSDQDNAKWKTIESRLNECGPEKSCEGWAKYLHEVVTELKTKDIVWERVYEGHAIKKQIKNIDDYTELDLKILQLWHKEKTVQDSLYHSETDYKNVNQIIQSNYQINTEYTLDDEDNDNSIDGDSNGEYYMNIDNENTDEIVTFTLDVAAGGRKPLLQAAVITPYEAPQEYSNANCMCKYSDSETQDEFDAFGKDIAQQLRSMPLQTALATQKILLAVLRSKQSKVINDSFL